MSLRKRSKHPRGPTVRFGSRVVALRELLAEDPAAAGDQALKLLEEYLESLARAHGFRGEGSLGRYTTFLRGRDGIPTDTIEHLNGYTEARNCLAHTYGLQTSPALAAELIDFAERLLKQGAATAGELMTRDVLTIDARDRLPRVRDLMLTSGFGRLPVLKGSAIAGLLTERDVVAAQALAERSGRPLGAIAVAEALADDAAERFVIVAPDATRETIAEWLRRPGVVACLVTPRGTAEETPIGIVTHADLLYRM
jgi:predicted transcriptional regulator